MKMLNVDDCIVWGMNGWRLKWGKWKPINTPVVVEYVLFVLRMDIMRESWGRIWRYWNYNDDELSDFDEWCLWGCVILDEFDCVGTSIHYYDFDFEWLMRECDFEWGIDKNNEREWRSDCHGIEVCVVLSVWWNGHSSHYWGVSNIPCQSTVCGDCPHPINFTSIPLICLDACSICSLHTDGVM